MLMSQEMAASFDKPAKGIENVVKKHLPEQVTGGESFVAATKEEFDREAKRIRNIEKGLPSVDRGDREPGVLSFTKNTDKPAEVDLEDENFKFKEGQFSGGDIQTGRLKRAMDDDRSHPLSDVKKAA